MKTENGILTPVSHVLSSSPSLHQALDCITLYTETESKETEKGLMWKPKSYTDHPLTKGKNKVVPMGVSTAVTQRPCHQLSVSSPFG